MRRIICTGLARSLTAPGRVALAIERRCNFALASHFASPGLFPSHPSSVISAGLWSRCESDFSADSASGRSTSPRTFPRATLLSACASLCAPRQTSRARSSATKRASSSRDTGERSQRPSTCVLSVIRSDDDNMFVGRSGGPTVRDWRLISNNPSRAP